MLNDTQVNDLILRTRRYPFRDGLPELAMAALWFVSGILGWYLFNFDLAKSDLGVLALMVIPVSVVLATRPIMNAIRRRWLWRESGWVETHPVAMPRWVFVIAGAVWLGAALITYALSRMRLVDDFFVMHSVIVSMGWGTAAFLIASGLYLKMMRYTAAGIVGALAIAPLLFSRVSFGESMLINGLVWGVLLSITGTLALRSAMRKSDD